MANVELNGPALGNVILTLAIVKQRFDWGEYVALPDPKATSEAWEMFHKIYDTRTGLEVIEPTKAERWFYCTECKQVLEKNVKMGTGPLLSHKRGHEKSALRAKAVKDAASAIASSSAPNAASAVVSTSAPIAASTVTASVPSVSAQQQTVASKATVTPTPTSSVIIDYESIPTMLAAISQLSFQHGPLKKEDFGQFLPTADQW